MFKKSCDSYLIQEESRGWFLKLMHDRSLYCTGFHLREVIAL